jgi:phage terminase small subunit
MTLTDNTYNLLAGIASGANATNLQTAVDSAKSHKGIDEEIHQLAQALIYKPHQLRQHQKDGRIYLHGKLMPTNTEEPIGWGVEQANQLYQEAKLPELDNLAFRDLIPRCCTPEQEAKAVKFAQQYNDQIKAAVSARERLQQKRPEDEQPTLTIQSSTSEREIILQRLCSADPESRSPIWRAEGVQADWQIRLERNEKINDRNPEKLTATLIYIDDTGVAQQQKIGYVSPGSEAKHQLEKLLGRQSSMTIQHFPGLCSTVAAIGKPVAKMLRIHQI